MENSWKQGNKRLQTKNRLYLGKSDISLWIYTESNKRGSTDILQIYFRIHLYWNFSIFLFWKNRKGKYLKWSHFSSVDLTRKQNQFSQDNAGSIISDQVFKMWWNFRSILWIYVRWNTWDKLLHIFVLRS